MASKEAREKMHVHAAFVQRAQLRYALLLAGIVALSLILIGIILAGPGPSDRKVADNPFTGATLDVTLEALPPFAVDNQSGDDEQLDAQSGPRAELDTATTFGPQAPVAPAARSIQLIGSEGWDPISASNVNLAMAALPDYVQAQLGNPALGPVSILVNFEGRTSSGYQPYGQAANFFSTNEGHNEVVLYPQQSVFTIVHELGHAYNLRNSPAGNYAWVLLEPEMQSFMEVAGWQVLTPPEEIAQMYDHSQVAFNYVGAPVWTSLSRNDPLEDFANSFADYFVSPSDLAGRSPERFAWFAARFP
jgi:hypothetical protein